MCYIHYCFLFLICICDGYDLFPSVTPTVYPEPHGMPLLGFREALCVRIRWVPLFLMVAPSL